MALVYPSIRPPVCHTHDPRLSSSTYRNAFCTIWQSDVRYVLSLRIAEFLFFYIFKALQLCRCGVAMSGASICPSVKCMNCDKTEKNFSHILTPTTWKVDAPSFATRRMVGGRCPLQIPEILGQTDPPQLQQVAQLSQRDRAAAWVSCGANINVVLRIQRTLL